MTKCTFGLTRLTDLTDLIGRPDPLVQKRNRAFLHLVLGCNPDRASSDWDSWHRKLQLGEELLKLDTGDWHGKVIFHHCRGIDCCPGGIVESRGKLWVAILVSWCKARWGIMDSMIL